MRIGSGSGTTMKSITATIKLKNYEKCEVFQVAYTDQNGALQYYLVDFRDFNGVVELEMLYGSIFVIASTNKHLYLRDLKDGVNTEFCLF